ncbi:MAG: DMT family transporter [Bacteroidales bacterium]|nr:DMT family transporter [Bacteroidales bacterium]
MILAILFSTLIFVVMRLFSRFDIDNHQGLAWNYATATVIGYIMSAANGPVTSPVGEAWFPLSILTGFWFILTYVLMVVSSQRSGVTVTSLSSKLSVVIPTLFGVVFLKEALGFTTAMGILLALTALFLVVGGKGKSQAKTEKTTLIVLLPVLIFFSTGIGDVLMKITEKANTASDLTPMIAFIYGISFLFSLLLVGYDLLKKKSKWQWKNMVGGMVLGGVNFFSTYFVYHAMRVFDNVVLFPIYNIGVVCLTALAGWLLFKEKLTWKNYLGLGIAIIAVVLIAFKP